MALTLWVNVMTGTRLNPVELEALRLHARRVYDANTHIFEDEADALTALGVVPLAELDPHVDRRRRGHRGVGQLSAA
jgi:hypothetical protein